MEPLDPHQRPPDGIRNAYKKYQRMKLHDLDLDPEIVDLSQDLSADRKRKVRAVREWDSEQLTAAFRAFAGREIELEDGQSKPLVSVYEHEDMPGLHIIPSLLPPDIQLILLSRLLHRDLSLPSHSTNIHAHYNISYPPCNSSFFSLTPSSTHTVAHPIDSSVHRPLGISQLLNKKMRWMTLGGQYDWTQKRYPKSAPPAFPPDIKHLLESIFPNTKAEAAIVNLYSPGDTLSIHRDVAEASPKGLISISLGCDAIFIIGASSPPFTSGDLQESASRSAEEKIITLRLRSGSAVYMNGHSRFAWHGVPQIVPGTCPRYLRDWPANGDDEQNTFKAWRGWMEGKRVNLNVRQMWD